MSAPLRSPVRLLIGAGVLLAALTAAPASSAAGSASSPEATPVVMVRGFGGRAGCPGTDVTKGYWGDAYLKLSYRGWTGPLLPVSFYRCDSDGVDITGYGPTIPAGATPTVTPDPPRAGYGVNTGMRRIAHDLAWFVYDTYSVNGTPVDMVGFSMGGLLIRYALYRVAAGDAKFPPYLDVARVATISTPHAGLPSDETSSICGSSTQCDQMAADSTFMIKLMSAGTDPQGVGGTAWSVAGSSGRCDMVSGTSALAMPHALRVKYVAPCYEHDAYLWDFTDAHDATMRITEPDAQSPFTDTAAPHVLRWLSEVLEDAFAPVGT